MYGEHVVERLSVYLDGGLSKQESEELAGHLIGCTFCRLEFEQIKAEAVLAEGHATIGDARQLVSVPRSRPVPSRSQERDHAEEIKGWFKKLDNRYFTIALVLAVLLSISALYILHTPVNVPSVAVATIRGGPVLGAVRVKGSVDLEISDWLETDSVSEATIKVAKDAELYVEPGTRIGLTRFDKSYCQLSLQHGKVIASISDPGVSGRLTGSGGLGSPGHLGNLETGSRSVLIDTPSGSVSGLGKYTAEVDDSGAVEIHVESGLADARLAGKNSFVPAGASCEMRPQVGPGSPFFDDASQHFKDALRSFDFGESGAADEPDAVDTLMKEARARDSLTLWHLLVRVNDNQRVRVIDRLIGFVELPAGITRQQVLQLDRAALAKYLTEIEQQLGIGIPYQQ